MPVSLYEEGDEVEEGRIAVQGHFHPLDVMRIDLVQMDGTDVLATYAVIRDVGDPEDDHNKTIMELSGAQSVNLWYSIDQSGWSLVKELDVVADLEECLLHYEQHGRGMLQ